MPSYPQGRVRRFFLFLKAYTTRDWQRSVAKVGILGTAASLSLLCLSILVLLKSDNPFAHLTWPYLLVATVTTWLLYWLDKKRIVAFGGVLLVVVYFVLGTSLMFRLGMGGAMFILFSLGVIMSTILYGLFGGLLPIAGSMVILVWFRHAELQGTLHPTYIFIRPPTDYDTVIAMGILLHVLVIACGIVHHIMVRANQRLRAVEAEKLQHLYRFAEIGEVSTALIHDLANHLTSLGLEIDNLKRDTKSSELNRAKRKVRSLQKTLAAAREQMKGRHKRETFDITKEISRTVSSLTATAQQANVRLEWKRPVKPVAYAGEKLSFQQVLTIMIKNGIDSYVTRRSAPNRRVRVALSADSRIVHLTITDWGKGIKPHERGHIFEPFYSTKKDGMGIGLYLSKRFIEDNLGGAITVNATKEKTVFSITLPKKKPPTKANRPSKRGGL